MRKHYLWRSLTHSKAHNLLRDTCTLWRTLEFKENVIMLHSVCMIYVTFVVFKNIWQFFVLTFDKRQIWIGLYPVFCLTFLNSLINMKKYSIMSQCLCMEVQDIIRNWEFCTYQVRLYLCFLFVRVILKKLIVIQTIWSYNNIYKRNMHVLWKLILWLA